MHAVQLSFDSRCLDYFGSYTGYHHGLWDNATSIMSLLCVCFLSSYLLTLVLSLMLFLLQLGCPFIDADSLHPDTNKAKMAQGTPLTDDVSKAGFSSLWRRY